MRGTGRVEPLPRTHFEKNRVADGAQTNRTVLCVLSPSTGKVAQQIVDVDVDGDVQGASLAFHGSFPT